MTHGPMRAIDRLQVCSVNRLKPALNWKADRELRGEFPGVKGTWGPKPSEIRDVPLSREQSDHICVTWARGIPAIAVTTTELIQLEFPPF